MASGGGSHPSHLPIPTPPSHGRAACSQSSSLQTPDASALFVSALGGRSGGGGNAGGTESNFAITPLDQAQSFTSLEELLDVTGINSMELGHSEVGMSKELVRGGHGVNCLQQLAREVEMNSSIKGINDAVAEPPSKRLCVDSSNSPTSRLSDTSHPPLNKLSQSSSSIRVQPLHPPSSSASFGLPMASTSLPQLQPPVTLSSSSSIASLSTSLPSQLTLPSSNSSAPIVSLLDKQHFSVSGNSSGLLDSLSSHHKQQQQQHFSTSTGGFVDLPSKVSNYPLHVPPPYSVAASSSSSQTFPQANALEYQQKRQFSTANSMSNHHHHLTEMSVAQMASPTMTHPQASRTSNTSRHPLPSILSQSSVVSQAQRINFANTNSLQTSAPPHSIAHAQNPKPAVSSTAKASQVAGNINSSSKAVVVQLIQLYKHYQALNDQQGMVRVREQIDFLVSAQQKILAAQNSVVKSSAASTIVNGPANQPVAGGGTASTAAAAVTATKATPVVVGGTTVPSSHSQYQEQQQQADRILGQLAAVRKPSQSQPPQQHHHQQQLTSAPLRQATGGGIRSVASSAMTKTQESSSMADFLQGSSNNGTGHGRGDSGGDGSVRPGVAAVSSSVGVQASSGGTGGVGHRLGHMPPSLLGHSSSGSGVSTHTTTATATAFSAPASQNLISRNPSEDTQKTVKRMQLFMASLPDSKRPKTVQELRDFVQQYSNLVNKGGGNFLSNFQTTTSLTSTASSNSPSDYSSLQRTRTQVATGLPPQAQAPVKTISSHAFESLPVRNNIVGSSQTCSPRPPVPVPPAGGLTSSKLPLSAPPSSSAMVVASEVAVSKHQSSSSGMVHAPVTTQFKGHGISVSSMAETPRKPSSAPILPPTSTGMSQSSVASTAKTGIQAGVAMPLPAGVTLETLGVLCRLPDSDLLKLNLPQPLLSAIKVWKVRQGPGTKTKVPSASNKSNIPVLIPPPSSDLPFLSSVPVCSGHSPSSSMVTLTKTSLNHAVPSSLYPPPPPPHSKTLVGQPNVIPSGVGFPPRSLHAYIPRTGISGTTPLHQTPSSGTHHPSNHMTRYKLKMEQQKAETERLQVLQKALQSSEEARIAYRFSAHLEKMRTQLMNPDTVSGFKSRHDVLARLLPYHIFAEPEPPQAAVEKADAVFESVAQVLLSRSRGLQSRFKRIMLKTKSQGGLEQSKMRHQLEQLFVEGEQERIRKENQEKKEAEQIAADLSLMADTVDSFDADFSFGDVFSPLMSMNSGVT